MARAAFGRVYGEEGGKGDGENLGLQRTSDALASVGGGCALVEGFPRTMVKNMTQSSHHRFRVIRTRTYSLRPTTSDESAQKIHVTVSSSRDRLPSASGGGRGAAMTCGGGEPRAWGCERATPVSWSGLDFLARVQGIHGVERKVG